MGLGPQEPNLLADMVRSTGREKFARFWTSREPVAAAFQAASGESLGSWTSRWASESYIIDPSGPRVPGWSGITCVLVLALGLLVAMRINSGRQFA